MSHLLAIHCLYSNININKEEEEEEEEGNNIDLLLVFEKKLSKIKKEITKLKNDKQRVETQLEIK